MVLNNKQASKNKIYLILSLILFAFSLIIFLISAFSVRFADIYSYFVSSNIRYILSLITGFFPVSAAELVLYTLPLFTIVIILLIVRKTVRFASVVSVGALVIASLAFVFVNSFGICYFCSPLDKRLDIERKSIDREELYNCSVIVENKLNSLLDNIEFLDDGSTAIPYNWSETDKRIDSGFDALRKDYPFISDSDSVAKKIIASKYMTYTHISGIYMPFTGEANVNTNYPDYVVAFSMAHEKAHQRGIANEDEANFAAFLALINSDDSYLQYAGYLSMYEYFLDSMYKYDKEMYYHMLKNADTRVLGELYAYSLFFDEYRDSKASDVADTVNDTYIKAMGDSKGVDSYGLVVELFSAYIKKKSLP